MNLRSLTRALLGTAALLFLASIGLVVLAGPKAPPDDAGSCPAQHEKGDLWVRWVEGAESADFTPAVRLGKETHRLERRSPGAEASPTAARAHLIVSKDGLLPCFCGRAEQLWKQSALPALDALQPGGRWVLAMDEFFPTPAPIEVPLDPEGRAVPREVALPAAGALVLKLWPLTGPAAFDAQVDIVVRALDAPHRPDDALRFRLVPGETRRLPEILVGQRFELELRALRGELIERVAIEGPQRAGEERAVELGFGENAPLLFAELRDAEDAPVRGEEVRALWIGDDGVHRRRVLRTRSSALACFSLDLPRDAARRGRLVFEASDGLHAAVLAVQLPGNGALDLGACELQPIQPRVAGRVVDTEGRGVAHAEIALTPLALADQRIAGSARQPPLLLTCDPQGWFTWQAEDLSQLRSAYAVLARDAQRSSRPHVVPAGSQLESFALQPAGTLGGRLRLPKELAPFAAVHLALPSGSELAHEWSYASAVDDQGDFGFANLAPGTYTLRVVLDEPQPWIEALAPIELERIDIASGERCEDPRVRELDVRARFSEFVFELRSGKLPVDATECRLDARSLPASRGWDHVRTKSIRGGLLVATLPAGRYDFRFRHPHYRAQIASERESGGSIDLLAPENDEERVDLEDPSTYPDRLDVRIEIAHGLEKPADLRALLRSLRLHWREHPLPAGVIVPLGDQRYRLRLPGGGPVSLLWTMPATERTPARNGSAEFLVESTRRAQSFAIDLSAR
ncbi:MAG: hypothetical protein IPN34_22950 [Planctomycetes bacterium]|nr:hypothetical protein [Planctomycetota bacterium]